MSGAPARVLRRIHLYNAAKVVAGLPAVQFLDDLRSVASSRKTRATFRSFYAGLVEPGDLCFDVGANIGNRVDALVAAGARVVAIDPQERCLRILRLRYSRNPRVTIVPLGLDSHDGTSVLYTSPISTISSMSQDWISAVKGSGRFSSQVWGKQETIRTTTLDRLIEQHGLPRFCKIDVEGFELRVLEGLSTAIPSASFEFSSENVALSTGCVARLDALGRYEFNYSVAETLRFARPDWVGAPEMDTLLRGFDGDPDWGDVYARLATSPS